MKRKLLLIFTLISSIVTLGQIPITGLSKEYLFTNGGLSNTATSGMTYDISIASQFTLGTVNDPINTPNNAITIDGESFNGNTHPTNQGDYTLSFWINTTDAQGGQIIEQRIFSSTFAGYVLFLDNAGAINFLGRFKYFNTYSNAAIATTNVSVNDGNWHHITVTAEKQARSNSVGQILNKYQYTIYVDGTQSAQNETNEIFVGTPVEIFDSGAALTFNPQNTSGNSGAIYTGDLDNYREYTRVLSVAETGQLANEFSSTSNVIYVDKDATGNNDGTNWANAFTDIKTAIESAANDKEIWIKGGTYIPNTAGSGIGIDISATGLKIYGGFAGTETQLSERIFGSNETIINGDVNGNDTSTPPVFSFSTPTTNDNIASLMRMSAFSNTEKTILDGLTFTRSYSQVGAGALVFTGDDFPNITITNCKFSNNLHANGGAIYSNYLVGFTNQNTAGLSIDINQCVFENNVAKLGAGIYIQNQDDFSSRFVNANINISNSLFTNNIITDDPVTTQGSVGSAMYIFQDDTQSNFNVAISNCTFSKNKELGTLSSNISNRYVVAVDNRVANYQNVAINNSIFWGNTTSGNAVATSLGNTFGINSDINTANNISEDNFANIPVGQQTNTQNSDPSFVDFTNNDFSLQGTSNAINVGDNNLVVGSSDLLNNQRITNLTVDLGAYEFNSTLSNTNFDKNETLISINPNPVSDLLNLTSLNTVEKLEIYSLLGQKIKQVLNKSSINVADIENGIYLLTVHTSVGVKSIRFIKK